MPTKAPIHRSQPKAAALRASACERGYDAEWNEFARRYRYDNPLCVQCKAKGITRAVEAVDHVIKLTLAPERKYDLGNLQSLCRECHQVKTMRGE